MTRNPKPTGKDPVAVELGRRGGNAYRDASTPEQRSASARHAAKVRWARARIKAEQDDVNTESVPST